MYSGIVIPAHLPPPHHQKPPGPGPQPSPARTPTTHRLAILIRQSVCKAAFLNALYIYNSICSAPPLPPSLPPRSHSCRRRRNGRNGGDGGISYRDRTPASGRIISSGFPIARGPRIFLQFSWRIAAAAPFLLCLHKLLINMRYDLSCDLRDAREGSPAPHPTSPPHFASRMNYHSLTRDYAAYRVLFSYARGGEAEDNIILILLPSRPIYLQDTIYSNLDNHSITSLVRHVFIGTAIFHDFQLFSYNNTREQYNIFVFYLLCQMTHEIIKWKNAKLPPIKFEYCCISIAVNIR
jgi:hypothetical protein